jgi:hypothetical protein
VSGRRADAGRAMGPADGDPRGEVGYHELVRDLAHPGCPVCRGTRRAARRYLDGILWESVNDGYIRRQLRLAHGFCGEHAQMALDVARGRGDGIGIAIMYRDFLEHIRAEAIRGARGRRRSALRTRSRPDPTALDPHQGCSVCETAGHVESNSLSLLARWDPESELGRAAHQPLRVLCLPHLRTGLSRVRTREEAERLLQVFLRGQEEIAAQLSEFIRKEDYQHRAEPRLAQDQSSWLRAVLLVVGERTR